MVLDQEKQVVTNASREYGLERGLVAKGGAKSKGIWGIQVNYWCIGTTFFSHLISSSKADTHVGWTVGFVTTREVRMCFRR